MNGVNKLILVGHVGKDPEIRRTQAGMSVAAFSLATSESWRDKATGERREFTEWHRVVVFNEALCGVVEKYVKKGSKLYVEGASKTRKFTDKDGVERRVTECVLSAFGAQLVLLDRAERAPVAEPDDYGEEKPRTDQPAGAPAARPSARQDLDDEIPF